MFASKMTRGLILPRQDGSQTPYLALLHKRVLLLGGTMTRKSGKEWRLQPSIGSSARCICRIELTLAVAESLPTAS